MNRSRRSFMQAVGGSLATSMVGASWLTSLARAADGKRAKSVVLLWLNGGPATIDLWDCKPGNKNGGPVKEIATATPGLRISEYLPKLANWTDDMVLIRSMTSREGDHGRATHLVRTGYVPQASIDFPDLGAVVGMELGNPESRLPNFVSIAPPSRTLFKGGGFLGPQAAPLTIGGPGQESEGLTVPYLKRATEISAEQHVDRQSLLRQLDEEYLRNQRESIVDNYKTASKRAQELMAPEVAKTFDLSQETDAVRDRYGRHLFGQGCLMTRRLIEKGVPFVEVTLDGWDTHQDNFNRVAALANQLDQGYAMLLADLAERGLLESTLIVCVGEFGRTPRINNSVGRDHWPATWSVALAGGGIQGGQAIGKTNEDGTQVEGESHGVPDLIATIAQGVGIDPRKQNDSNVGRPIRVADPDANIIAGVF